MLLIVILGNPSAGGANLATLLPPFWRALSGALPNGAGTDAVRRIVYFNADGIGGHLLDIVVYVVAGAIVTIAGTSLHHRRRDRASRDAAASVLQPAPRV